MTGFGISQGKGFHVTFANGWTVSVQFGIGNYCDNRSLELDLDYIDQDGETYWPCVTSGNAEIAAWDANGKWYSFNSENDYETVKGWVGPDELLAFMNEIASK
jgi:hypothetical protein